MFTHLPDTLGVLCWPPKLSFAFVWSNTKFVKKTSFTDSGDTNLVDKEFLIFKLVLFYGIAPQWIILNVYNSILCYDIFNVLYKKKSTMYNDRDQRSTGFAKLNKKNAMIQE